MDRQGSKSSRSTLDDLPNEKNDPLFNHLRNVDAAANFEDLNTQYTNNKGDYNPEETEYTKDEVEYDLESQTPAASTMGKSLTRADTAAWVTKHPSRIPDDGTRPAKQIVDGSDEEEGVDLYCGI